MYRPLDFGLWTLFANRASTIKVRGAKDPRPKTKDETEPMGLHASTKLCSIPLDNLRADEQSRNCANAKKHTKRQQHLHVSLALPRHQNNSDQRARQYAQEDV